jgi:hypothetical protein
LGLYWDLVTLILALPMAYSAEQAGARNRSHDYGKND